MKKYAKIADKLKFSAKKSVNKFINSEKSYFIFNKQADSGPARGKHEAR